MLPTVYGLQAYRREGQPVRSWTGFALERVDGRGSHSAPGPQARLLPAGYVMLPGSLVRKGF